MRARASPQPRPPLDAHNALALTLAEELGVAPDPLEWPELAEPLLFGPMLPPRYRLDGPGRAGRRRADRFAEQLAASPRARSIPPTSRRCAASGSVARPRTGCSAPQTRPARSQRCAFRAATCSSGRPAPVADRALRSTLRTVRMPGITVETSGRQST